VVQDLHKAIDHNVRKVINRKEIVHKANVRNAHRSRIKVHNKAHVRSNRNPSSKALNQNRAQNRREEIVHHVEIDHLRIATIVAEEAIATMKEANQTKADNQQHLIHEALFFL
jgi:hypothetical protein